MSVATLKYKTLAKYNNNSVGVPQFSLNGGYRNQGWVGQTSLSRSLPRTLMRDGVARGHGGRQGTFVQTPIVTSSINYQEDSRVIKSSVLDTAGMLEKRTQWSRRPPDTGSGSAWKQDVNGNLGTAQDRTFKLRSCTQQQAQCNTAQASLPPLTTACCTRSSRGAVITKAVTKDFGSTFQQRPVAMSYGDYLLKVNAQVVDKVQGTTNPYNRCTRAVLRSLL